MPDGGGGIEHVDHALLKVFSEVKSDVSAWGEKAERLLNALTHPDSTDKSVAPPNERVDRQVFDETYRKPLRTIVSILNGHTPLDKFPQLFPGHSLQSLKAFIRQRNNRSWMNDAERASIELELERLNNRFDDLDFLEK